MLPCAQAIDQTITLTYQIQCEFEIVSDCLKNLQNKICQDALNLIDTCKTNEEIDFIFPEIVRIYNHDLAVISSWQNTVDWQRSLSPSEKKLLENSDFSQSDVNTPSDLSSDSITEEVPDEISLYENLKRVSHFESLREQLKFMLKPDLRQERESYISQQAIALGYKGLAPSNWQEIPDLTVANLYYYFRDKHKV
jgi:hypothetical protein